MFVSSNYSGATSLARITLKFTIISHDVMKLTPPAYQAMP
jgi:hypothetical protein